MKNIFSSKQKILFSLVIFFLLVFLLTFFLTGLGKDRKAKSGNNEAVPTVSLGQEVSIFRNEKSKANLTIKDSLIRSAVGKPVSLIIVADSNKNNISGFDFLVSYDKTAFTFEKAMSLNDSFNLLTLKGADKLTLTGSKKFQINQQVIFENSQLVELIFTPIRSGQFTFSLLPSSGKEKSQMVDINSVIIYPRLNNLTVEVDK